MPVTFRLPAPLPVPSVQLNLKIPEVIATDWRQRAKDAGHASVRDWLLSVLNPEAEPVAGLADRVAALEAAVAALQQAPPTRRVVMPTAPAEAAPGEPLDTPQLAARLGIQRGTLNTRIRRAGGPVPGLVIDGWRCLGMGPARAGGADRAYWVPADVPPG